MSFMLTTEQVRNRTKTVTRRTGWKTLKPGTIIAEGFYCVQGWHTPAEFISRFCNHNRCQQWDEITRIEFEYVDDAKAVA